MARMLQALKNLEAKSVRIPAKKAVAQEVEAVGIRAAAGCEIESHSLGAEFPPQTASPSWEAESPAIVPEIANIEIADIEIAESKPLNLPSSLAEPPAAPPNTDWGTQERGFVVSLSLPSMGAASQSAPAAATQIRPACTLESAIKRTLRDPVRSRPLLEMAERLHRDIVQNECRTLVFVGIGAASTTQETILYAATLLAEREQERVLLIDADAARQSLTAGLEYDSQRGLTELLSSDAPPGSYCQLTAVGGLTFLPAGLARHTDLSTTASQLEQTLERLKSEFSCVLIDGGRTSDLSATALARQADATYLVVQLGAIDTSEAQAALRDLRAAGARVLGCIAT